MAEEMPECLESGKTGDNDSDSADDDILSVGFWDRYDVEEME